MEQKKYLIPDESVIPTSFKVNQHLLTESIAVVAGYNASVSNTSIDPNFLLFLLSNKEAETSSRIEGTDITFQEVMQPEDNAVDEDGVKKRSAIREALGVRYAIEKGSEMIEKENIPFSNRVIKAMHYKLMSLATLDQGVSGEFRTHSVRVGNRYFPPEPQHISDMMSDLEKYIHADSDVSSVVKIAVVHAQFEIIHPFSDGNGRIGRLLIPLLLKEYGLTDTVSFFLSTYIERQRGEYYARLENITKQGDWDGWVHFFLSSVAEHGAELKQKVDTLNKLYMDGHFLKLKSVASQHIKNYIFKHPFFTVPNMIRHFEKNNISLVNQHGLHRTLTSSPDIEVFIPGKGGKQTRYICRKIVDVIQDIKT